MHVTIAADAAVNTNAGFVTGSMRHLHAPKVVTFVHQDHAGRVLIRQRCTIANVPFHRWRLPAEQVRLHVPQIREHAGHILQEEMFSPLLTCGWVFQERVLSPRTLHFGSSESGWECLSLMSCECSYLCKADNVEWWQNLSKKRVQSWEWMKIVGEYTVLKLIVQEDRLVALAGLAKVRESHGEFFAGMWIGNIKNELLWGATNSEHRLDIAPTCYWTSTTAWVHKADECGTLKVMSVARNGEDYAFKAFRFKAIVTIRACLTKIMIQRASFPELHHSEYYVWPRHPSCCSVHCDQHTLGYFRSLFP